MDNFTSFNKILIKYSLGLFSVFGVSTLLSAQDFQVLAHSDNSVTTHKLSSGTSGFEIGITSNGGGVINFIGLPGKGDIMRLASDRYGRAGQLAFRDSSHDGSYNPTQAGYNEDLGTKCKVIRDGKKLIIPQRGLALWFGDGRYDYTEWENIGSDSKDSDSGNSDKDGLDESNLPGKQAEEVLSEFDYYGTYEDLYGENGINVSAIRHYFEASFIREPGHCISQFGEGTPAFNESALRREITNKAPSGRFPGTDKDLNGVIAVWSLRNDVSKWDYDFVYFKNTEDKWVALEATKNVPASYDQSILIMAESSNPNSGRALGLYKPNSAINNLPVVGIDERFGTISYKDDRIRLAAEGTKITHSKFRAPSMSKYGFSNRFSGMINRTRLQENLYEIYRGEYYILYGTPQEIMDNVSKINNVKISQHISFSAFEEKNKGDEAFYPSAFSDSRLAITFSSSNTDVAKIENGKVVLVGAGVTTITAIQPGNTLYKAATAVSQVLTVNSKNSAPTAILTFPADGSEFELGQTIELIAEASDEDGNLDKVNFKIDDVFFGQDKTSPFKKTFVPENTGTYKIAARAFDSEGLFFESFVTIKVVTSISLSSNTIVEKKPISALKLYPLPTNDFLTVLGITGHTPIEIMDMTGKIVLKTSVNRKNNKVNVSALSNGLYFFRVFESTKQKSIVFVKK